MAFKNIMSGILGNMSEVSTEELQKEYGPYLMDSETISIGFKLVRDVVLFTDKRVIYFNKQGATGQKMSVETIKLSTIVDVTAETAGFGLDDSEITLTYVVTPYLRSHSTELAKRKFEFPKKYNIQPLYKMLIELSFANCDRINSL